jgi:hypothetical protein
VGLVNYLESVWHLEKRYRNIPIKLKFERACIQSGACTVGWMHHILPITPIQDEFLALVLRKPTNIKLDLGDYAWVYEIVHVRTEKGFYFPLKHHRPLPSPPRVIADRFGEGVATTLVELLQEALPTPRPLTPFSERVDQMFDELKAEADPIELYQGHDLIYRQEFVGAYKAVADEVQANLQAMRDHITDHPEDLACRAQNVPVIMQWFPS